MTVQNVGDSAKSGFGDDLADSVTEPVETPEPDSDPDDTNPGGDAPADPATEGDNPAH